jgi:hypothetical protein
MDTKDYTNAVLAVVLDCVSLVEEQDGNKL